MTNFDKSGADTNPDFGDQFTILSNASDEVGVSPILEFVTEEQGSGQDGRGRGGRRGG